MFPHQKNYIFIEISYFPGIIDIFWGKNQGKEWLVFQNNEKKHFLSNVIYGDYKSSKGLFLKMQKVSSNCQITSETLF